MSATDFNKHSDLYKNKKAEVQDTLRYVHDTYKSFATEDGYMDDSLMLTVLTRLTPVLAFFSRELNGRQFRGEQKGDWRMDLLKAFQEKYPEFEDEWAKNN